MTSIGGEWRVGKDKRRKGIAGRGGDEGENEEGDKAEERESSMMKDATESKNLS